LTADASIAQATAVIPGGPALTWTALADAVADLVIRADRFGRITYASAAARRFGYEPEELVGRLSTDFVHPDDLPGLLANSAALFAAGPAPRHVNREHRFRHKDGSWVWLEGNPAMLASADGELMEILNIFRDVTERRAIRDALTEQTRRAALAEAVGGVGYWRLDAASLEMSWSNQMFDLFGMPHGEAPPLAAALAMIHPDDKAESAARQQHTLRTGEGWNDVVMRIVHANGDIRFINSRAVAEVAADGTVTSVFGTMVDVTEEKLANEAIAKSERSYRLLAENVTDTITLTASDGRILYVSPSVERLTGLTLEELLPTKMSDYVHPDDLADFLAAYRGLLREAREPGPIRFRARHKTGRWMWLESNPKLVRSADGQSNDIIDVTREVTEDQKLRQQLQAALAEAERASAVKAAFLANMSHEIRTPLTAVLGFANLLAERSDLDADASRQVERIGGAGRALLAIVNDVLDFSKLEAGQMSIALRPTAAVDAAREVLELFTLQAEAKSIALHFEAAADVPAHLMTDPDRLRQILLNLIGNAVKFTDRGAVSLRLAYEPLAGVLSAEVTDTGPGIAAAQRQKLFQRFSQVDGSSTRTKGGTGLGLAISHGLAVAMGGGITVRSRPGRGSTFRLELPAQTAAVAPVGPAGAAAPDMLAGLRVLVVDDNANNRELARAILEIAGVDVSEACDGAEAVRIAQGRPFDLILMDLRMPVMDGRSALAAIRGAPGPNRDMPILAFSADGGGDLQGFQGWVSKPILPATLLAAIADACGEDSAFVLESPDAAAA
jgi:PAS domain S-box-containing protein